MNKEAIIKLFPNSLIEKQIEFFDEAFSFASINTDARIIMFIAQVGHECQYFTDFEENLNYGAQGLANTWPKLYAVNPNAKVKVPNDLAKKLHRKPIEIANTSYAFKNGNGSIQSGDGWRYRGRGDIQITGRANYLLVDDDFNMNGKILANPQLLIEPYWAIMSAASFWKRNGLNRWADSKNIVKARRVINGGVIGLEKVITLYHEAEKALAS